MCWEPACGRSRAAGGLLGVAGAEAWRGTRGGFGDLGPVTTALVELCWAYAGDTDRSPVEVAARHAGVPLPAWLLPVAFVRLDPGDRERELGALADAADVPRSLRPACLAYVELTAQLFAAQLPDDAVRVARRNYRWAAAPKSNPTTPRLLGIGPIDGLVASAWALSQESSLAFTIGQLVDTGSAVVEPWVAASAAGPLGVRDGSTAIPARWLRWLPRRQGDLCSSLADALVAACHADRPQAVAG
jgi:hypothetical protein